MRTRVLIIALSAALILSGLSVLVVGGSSHREAPLITEDPLADNTDVYAFVDTGDPSKLNLIANWIPLEEPSGGPNFFRFADDVLYEIHIDNNGNATPDITYQFRFDTQVANPNTFLYNTGPIGSLADSNWNVRQFYSVTRVDETHPSGLVLGSGLATPPVNIGPESTPNYEGLAAAAVHDLGNGVNVFAGQRDDPFYVDLGATFDLLTIRVPPGGSGGGVDGLGGFNVHSIALQVPIDQVTQGDEPVIGVWSTTSRPAVRVLRPKGQEPVVSGPPRQVSRLGMPLVNEVVIPLGMKDKFNASSPADDGQFLNFVTEPELAQLLNDIHDLGAPTTDRQDLVAVFLTGIPSLNQPADVEPSEMIRLNTAELFRPGSKACKEDPNRLGVLGGDACGFPNGRRLADDVVDIELQAVCGATYQILVDPKFELDPRCAVLGDGVDHNDKPFLSSFPYLGMPHQGSDHAHHPTTPFMPPGSTNTALGIGAGLLVTGLALGAVFTLRRRNWPGR